MIDEQSNTRWLRVEELFHAALQLAPQDRGRFLEKHCGEDRALQDEVARLVKSNEQLGSFLEAPALQACPSTPRLAIDQLVARRYRIVRFIARGGMGEVYEAFDEDLGERVALKVLREEIAADPANVERFKRETQISRRVTHPNVCRVFEFGLHAADASAFAFFTMELLEGGTLSERLRAGRLAVHEARSIVSQIAAALDAAHAAGVVHRDMKSGNVLLVPAGDRQRVVVTDFGLSTAAGGGAGDSASLAGTPDYMSPEQVEGRPATKASDIYAFGVILYEIATGARPFVAETPLALAAKRLVDSPTPPRVHAPDIDPRWERTILRCLERHPADRFETASQAVASLDATTARPRNKTAWGASLAASLAVAIALWNGVGVDVGGSRAALPSDSAAASAYVEGLQRLRIMDFQGAAALLRTAISQEPGFALSHYHLAAALQQLGDEVGARPASKQALQLAAGLPREDRLAIEAQDRGLNLDPATAQALYQSLFRFSPDNLEHGLRALRYHPRPEDTRRVLATLRALPGPSGQDVRIDLAEASLWQPQDLGAMRAAAARAVAKARALAAPSLLARALEVQGELLHQLGESGAAIGALVEARAIHEGRQDRLQAMKIDHRLVTLFVKTGRLDQAATLVDRSLPIAEQAGQRSTQIELLYMRGSMHREQGDLAAAERALLSAAKVARSFQSGPPQAWVRGALGRIWRLQGRLAEAHAVCDETSQWTVDDSSPERLDLARVLLDEGETQEPRRLIEKSVAARSARGMVMDAAEASTELAWLEIAERRFSQAEATARAAAATLGRAEYLPEEALARAALLRALVGQGRWADARKELGRREPGAAGGGFGALMYGIERGRVHLAARDPVAARALASEAVALSKRGGFAGPELRAKLLWAEAEAALERSGESRDQLLAVLSESKSRRLGLLEREARTLLDAVEGKKPQRLSALVRPR